jgi:hypothetical protein
MYLVMLNDSFKKDKNLQFLPCPLLQEFWKSVNLIKPCGVEQALWGRGGDLE